MLLSQAHRHRGEPPRGVEALGAEQIDALSPCERWITAFATILFQKGVLTPEGLAVRMQQVEARWDHGNQHEEKP